MKARDVVKDWPRRGSCSTPFAENPWSSYGPWIRTEMSIPDYLALQRETLDGELYHRDQNAMMERHRRLSHLGEAGCRPMTYDDLPYGTNYVDTATGVIVGSAPRGPGILQTEWFPDDAQRVHPFFVPSAWMRMAHSMSDPMFGPADEANPADLRTATGANLLHDFLRARPASAIFLELETLTPPAVPEDAIEYAKRLQELAYAVTGCHPIPFGTNPPSKETR